MALGGGDQLARGAVSAQFSVPDVSEERWKQIFGEEGLRKLNAMDEKDRLALQEQALPLVKSEPVVIELDFDLKPVQDRIIVRRVEAEDKTASGLFLADETKEKPYEGLVVAVGPGKHIGTEFVKPTVNIGDRVVFGKFSGAEVKVGVETLLVLREEDIFYRKVKRIGNTHE
jgi:chaperonin GroES